MAAPRVLVVDDNMDIGALMELLLTDRGCDVRTAVDGPSALKVAEDLGPDVVFLDLNLPGMDGYELARRLRASSTSSSADGRPRRPALVLLSGYVDDVVRAKAHESGIDAVMEKVGDVDALERALLAHLPSGRRGA